MKKNCWEHTQCGREPGGCNAEKLGICPAAVEERLNGVHGGKNAGRTCWVVSGTLCEDKVQGTFASILRSCLQCEFYKEVVCDEKGCLTEAGRLLEKLADEEEQVQMESPASASSSLR